MTQVGQSRCLGVCREKRCLSHLGLLAPKLSHLIINQLWSQSLLQFLKIFEATGAQRGELLKDKIQVESLLNSVKGRKIFLLIALGAFVES